MHNIIQHQQYHYQNRRWEQGGIEDTSGNIKIIHPPISIYKGDSQGGSPRETQRGESRKIPNEKRISIKQVTYEENLRVTIVEKYPEELQPSNLANKTIIFWPIRSKNLTVIPKNEIYSKTRTEKKADTPEAQPHVIP